MKTVCFIPARSGSVRVPRKNTKLFHGEPIIAYPIASAKKSGLFDEILVSTDDHEMAAVISLLHTGARIVQRPYDDGTTGTQEVAARYLRDHPEVTICCVLYPTAALLDWSHIAGGWQTFLAEGRPYAYSTNAAGDDIGGFYWGFAEAFREGLPLDGNSVHVRLGPEVCCDINTPEDFQRAERMYLNLKRN